MRSYQTHHITSGALSVGMQFNDLILCQNEITQLYRGLESTAKMNMLFQLPTILFGEFGVVFPDCLSMSHVERHKTSNQRNSSGGQHLVSMSSDATVSNGFGNNSYFIIDPTLFSDYIVDVHQSYKRHVLTMPGRMENEQEYLAPAVLTCSIKHIVLDGRIIANPFYLALSPDNKSAISAFKMVYDRYLHLLRQKYSGMLTQQTEQEKISDFIKSYLAFYAQYSEANRNPFAMSIDTFSQYYPEYGKVFLNGNDSLFASVGVSSCQVTRHTFFQEGRSLQQIAMQHAASLFAEHAYLKNEQASMLRKTETLYEDPWACPNYD